VLVATLQPCGTFDGLSQIWSMCDIDQKAYLDANGFMLAMRFISLAQSQFPFNLASLVQHEGNSTVRADVWAVKSRLA
jgi:hypothetical protein